MFTLFIKMLIARNIVTCLEFQKLVAILVMIYDTLNLFKYVLVEYISRYHYHYKISTYIIFIRKHLQKSISLETTHLVVISSQVNHLSWNVSLDQERRDSQIRINPNLNILPIWSGPLGNSITGCSSCTSSREQTRLYAWR